MPASSASMDRESENGGCVNPYRFSALENRSKRLLRWLVPDATPATTNLAVHQTG